MSTSIKSTAEVVVIGAGVVGSSVAYHLALRGVRDILVIDRANGPGLGSTGRATGGARAQFGTEINIKMSMYSLKFFAESDFKCDYDPKGYLFFTNRAEEFARLKANLALQKSLGLDEVVTVTPEEIAELCPIIDTSRTRMSQVTHYFFEDCIYVTPVQSIPELGEWYVRDSLVDISTGATVPLSFQGNPVEVIPLGNGRSFVQVQPGGPPESNAALTPATRARIVSLENELDAIKRSLSYRLGQLMTAPGRKVRGLKRRKHSS